MSNPSKTAYSEEQRENLFILYRLCLTRQDKVDLTEEEGIEKLNKTYCLVSRMGATRTHKILDDPWNDPVRLFERLDLDGFEWLPKFDRYIVDAWRKLFVEQIAFRYKRYGMTETAVMWRARQLGLRKLCYYWDVKKVLAWLGLSFAELQQLAKPDPSNPDRHTLDIYPCRDKRGKVKVMLISTMSLARVLHQDNLWQHLVDERGADKIFVIEEILKGTTAAQLTSELFELRRAVEEAGKASEEQLQQMQDLELRLDEAGGETVFEPNVWVSHSHTSLNPRSGASFGWFFDGYDTEMPGYNDEPADYTAVPRDEETKLTGVTVIRRRPERSHTQEPRPPRPTRRDQTSGRRPLHSVSQR